MKSVDTIISKVGNYCSRSGYMGWDPYDGLNSKVFQITPFKKLALARLAWIQLFKKNPVNLRKLFLVPKGYNSKGLGLFLTAYCNLYKTDPSQAILEKIKFLANKIVDIQSPGYSGACWGYNFDWQSKAFFLPIYTPTVVATSFVAESLLNAYEITGDKKYYDIGISSADFILKDLKRIKKENGFMFSYSPIDDRAVYNATLLGTRLLARIYYYTGNKEYKHAAFVSALKVVERQHDNGAFPHSDQVGDKWRDSFHTAFKLESLFEYQKYCKDDSFKKNIEIGFKYWIENFFLQDGTPRYYDSSTYPIDIHCPAQFFSAMYKMNKFKDHNDISERIYNWTINNMFDENIGYFYYQRTKNSKNKIPYIRWSQAWAMYGLSYWHVYLKSKENG